MKCEESRENLAAYLDGEIEGAPRRAMDDHFALCAACAAEKRAQAAAWRLLDLASPPSAPADFRERVLARVLLALAAVAGCGAPARAQDPAPPAPVAVPAPVQVAPGQGPQAAPVDAERAERIRLAKVRWAAMSPDERERARRRFEQWKALSPEQREDMRRRLEEMGGREGAQVVRRRMEDLRKKSPEQIQRMRLQRLIIGGVWQRFLDQLRPPVSDQWAALPAPAKERLARKFARGFVEMGREAVVRKFATEEERTAIEGQDAPARRAALASMKKRIREQVLAPHRDEMEKLPPEERRAREVRLLEEHFWACAQEGLPDRLPQFRAAFEKALTENPGAGGRAGHEGVNPEGLGRFLRTRFQREFGLPPEDLGAPWATFALVRALRLRAPQDQPAFLEAVRPELRRIAALPAERREEELKALLERLK